MKKYLLEITDEHIPSLLKALEFYTRFKMGQFGTVFEEYPKLGWDDRQNIHQYIRQYVLKDMPVNASYGVFSPELDEDAKISHDIYQVIRHKHAWDKREETKDDVFPWQVWYDSPMQCSKIDLPKMLDKE